MKIVHESLAASLPYELRTRKLVASSLTIDAKECGLGFAAIKLAAVTAMTVGLTFLLMPYMFLLGMVLSTIIVSMIRILIVEIALVGIYSSRFKC